MCYVKLSKMVFHIFHSAIVEKFSPFFKKPARPAVNAVENSVENVKYLRGQPMGQLHYVNSCNFMRM